LKPTVSRSTRIKGLKVADQIAKLAATLPDAFGKQEIYRTAQNLRTHYGWTDEEKDAEILKFVRIGCNTYQDLVNELGLSAEVLAVRVKAMVAAGKLDVSSFGNGGPGRKTALIREIATNFN
jgi:hypothetical protein